MKTKYEVNIQGKPAFYACLYNSMKQKAIELWYSLAIHWSMHSDMDLIAVAWIEEAQSPEELMKAINDCIGNSIWKYHNECSRSEKPHWRIAYSIHISPDWVIDLSIIPPVNK